MDEEADGSGGRGENYGGGTVTSFHAGELLNRADQTSDSDSHSASSNSHSTSHSRSHSHTARTLTPNPRNGVRAWTSSRSAPISPRNSAEQTGSGVDGTSGLSLPPLPSKRVTVSPPGSPRLSSFSSGWTSAVSPPISPHKRLSSDHRVPPSTGTPQLFVSPAVQPVPSPTSPTPIAPSSALFTSNSPSVSSPPSFAGRGGGTHSFNRSAGTVGFIIIIFC